MTRSKTKKAARESTKLAQKQKASNTQDQHEQDASKLTQQEIQRVKKREKQRACRARRAARKLAKRQEEARAQVIEQIQLSGLQYKLTGSKQELAIVPEDEQSRNPEQSLESYSNVSTRSDQRMASPNANCNGTSSARQSMREKDQAHASTSEVQNSLSQEHSSVLGHIGHGEDAFFSGDDPMAGTLEQEAFHQFDKVRVFLRKRNYANPLVFYLLYATGFSKLAQFESLAFAIITASPADWAMLEDGRIWCHIYNTRSNLIIRKSKPGFRLFLYLALTAINLLPRTSRFKAFFSFSWVGVTVIAVPCSKAMAKSKSKKADRESKKPAEKQKPSNTQKKHQTDKPKLTKKEKKEKRAKRGERRRAYNARRAARRLEKRKQDEEEARVEAIAQEEERVRAIALEEARKQHLESLDHAEEESVSEYGGYMGPRPDYSDDFEEEEEESNGDSENESMTSDGELSDFSGWLQAAYGFH
ncbi:hypothetical protein JR316_0013379 [Psilocybe cubensis]|uniref:Uncharacterized protein n=1 Tax=Psilocybe cubensis TaxID=181762 RepID=A0ACB8GI77_PSICU|nr:hypothetical protein JR316_0013379 [Psilocybe cubensis]KAH9474911.1 hypothetical protein JR316_0013379 [Psilocybe cubensis]